MTRKTSIMQVVEIMQDAESSHPRCIDHIDKLMEAHSEEAVIAMLREDCEFVIDAYEQAIIELSKLNG